MLYGSCVPSTYVWTAQCDNVRVLYIDDGNVVTTTNNCLEEHSAQIALTVGQNTLRIVCESNCEAGVAFSLVPSGVGTVHTMVAFCHCTLIGAASYI